MFVVLMLNAVGDLIDLMNALDPASMPILDNMDPRQLRQYVLMNGHCSALIKVLIFYILHVTLCYITRVCSVTLLSPLLGQIYIYI